MWYVISNWPWKSFKRCLRAIPAVSRCPMPCSRSPTPIMSWSSGTRPATGLNSVIETVSQGQSRTECQASSRAHEEGRALNVVVPVSLARPARSRDGRGDAQAAPERLRISEIFYSLQGEAVTVGLPTVFVRLTGCPLRCVYCDTEYAFQCGEHWSLPSKFATR